jgi:threonine dehydrogenase-like Zn-dependent dehydrogenase
MGASVLAAVMTGPGKTELREYPFPAMCKDDGLLRVETCGVSQTDSDLFRRGDLAPAILGHEIVGTVERVGSAAAAHWQVKEGDRVIVQEYVPCGECDWCAQGEYRLCARAQVTAPNALRLGMTGVDVTPGLWGGFAQYLYLHPRCVVHRVPDAATDSLAILTLPIANGVQWAAIEGEISSGHAVLIFGGGLLGLAAVRAALAAGASTVILCGLAREGERLALGKPFGANFTFNADEEGLEDNILAATDRRGADVIVDTTDDTSGRVAATAIKSAAIGARLVLGGIGLVPLHLGEIRRKYLTIKPVRGHSTVAVNRALEILENDAELFHSLSCALHPLSETAMAIRAGDFDASPGIIKAGVRPWM